MSVSCLARSLGPGWGRNAPMIRTLGRLVDFGMARIDGKAFAIRRSFPRLAASQIARLPDHLVELHAEHLAAGHHPGRAEASG